ncbi:hypothetical protein BDZ91DRAFT_846379 [Kalaharituber pfeilii]|nr:hypothetical protein BDZ91DRAFT_846379 [Kalaharituber pfeilii]
MAASIDFPDNPSNRPSPLLQLLKEAPRYTDNFQSLPVGSQDAESKTEIPIFATSKLVGRLSAVGTTSGTGVFGVRSGRGMQRISPRTVIGGIGGIEEAKGGKGGVRENGIRRSSAVSLPLAPPNPTKVSKSAKRIPSSSGILTIPTSDSSQVEHLSSGQLPTIKRPSLKTELRRRVLLNAAAKAKPMSSVEPRIHSASRSSSRSSMRGNRSARGARAKPKVSIAEIGTQDVTKLVKGMCTTEDEIVVREKLSQFLQSEENAKQKGSGAEEDESRVMPEYHENDYGYDENDDGDIPPPFINVGDATGTLTRNLRQHLTSHKISHKKEVLERAFGWHSRLLDEEDIEEQMGRPVQMLTRQEEDSVVVPIGESASGSERWIGATKVPGSVSSGGVQPVRRGEWVTEDEKNADTVLVGNGKVRKGKRSEFQIDQARIQPTLLPKTRRGRQQPLPFSPLRSCANSPSERTTQESSAISRLPTGKRSLQRFDRVEDWLDHQEQHGDNTPHHRPAISPIPQINIPSLASANPMNSTLHNRTPRSKTSSAYRNPHTPSAPLLERKFPFSLARLPYLKHTLKNGGKGNARGGGVVTISPPTDSDTLGYIHLDLTAKRYVYTIIPGSGPGTVDIGKYTMVIVQPRRRYNKSEHARDLAKQGDVKRENTGLMGEEVYELSELPVKHLSVVKFASKFVGIVRRGTVVVRVEGQNSGSAPGSRGAIAVEKGGDTSANPKWEWYRGEIFADGRFEFTIIPRGGILGTSGEVGGGGGGVETVVLLGGVVKIIFRAMLTGSLAGGGPVGIGGDGERKNAIPQFIGSKTIGNVKLRRVHVEIMRTVAPSTSSSASKSSSTVWSGPVDLGQGTAHAATVFGSEKASQNVSLCAGFHVEVDWARRIWIECKRLLEKGK